MTLVGPFISNGPLSANLYSLGAMALLMRHKLDAAVALLVVIPVH